MFSAPCSSCFIVTSAALGRLAGREHLSQHAHDLVRHGAGGEAEALSCYVETRLEGTVARFEAQVGATRIGKAITLDGAAVTVRYRVDGGAGGRLATTLDLAMPSCDGIAGRYIVGGSIPGGFGQPLDLASASEVVLDDRHMQGSVLLHLDPPARVAARPYRTQCRSRRKASSA